MKVHVRIDSTENIRIKDIYKCESMFFKLHLNDPDVFKITRKCKEDPINFSKDILSIPFGDENYNIEKIQIKLIAVMQNEETEIAALLLPLKICRYDMRVSGKFKMTPHENVIFRGYPKIKISIHIGKRRFSNSKPMNIPLNVINEFVQEQNLETVGYIKDRIKNVPSSLPKSSRRRSDLPDYEHKAATIQAKIEEAMARAPSEIWSCFEDPDFIHRCLVHYGIRDNTRRNSH